MKVPTRGWKVMEAAGLIVVRLPQFVGERYGDFLKSIRRNGVDINYRGFDRDPWLDIDDMAYAGSLSPEEGDIFNQIECKRDVYLDCIKVEDFDFVHRVIEISNSISIRNEIIYLSTKEDKKLIKIINGEKFYFRGFDFYNSGLGSVLRRGAFEKPEIFEEFHHMINGDGLFSTESDLLDYVDCYDGAYEANNLETMDKSWSRGIVGVWMSA